MNSKVAIVGILTLTALAFATDSALAMPSSGWLKNYCVGRDGIYFPPNNSGVYGCVWSDKSYFCGGAIRGCNWYN
jgi:hypothetical protein